MKLGRRGFIKGSATMTAGGFLAARPSTTLSSFTESVTETQKDRVKALIELALEVAQHQGAVYADVRMMYSRGRSISAGLGQAQGSIDEAETMTVGVRALYKGYWGFAAGPIWSEPESRRLATQAVSIAKVNAQGKPREFEMIPTAIANGHWETPVEIDPFEVSPNEIVDYIFGLKTWIERVDTNVRHAGGRFSGHEALKAFGSTEGAYTTQKLVRSQGDFSFSYSLGQKSVQGYMDSLTKAGVGLELLYNQPLREYALQEIEELKLYLSLPLKPIDVGRYDVVLDAAGVGDMLHKTVGDATQLTRAMTFDANKSGTSYITDPSNMLGELSIGNRFLNVTSNRDEEGGLHTVKWDDEGVVPAVVSLVTDGILTGFSTTRESASWLKTRSADKARSPSSAGRADADLASDLPKTINGNLQMKPGKTANDFIELMESMGKGIAFRRMRSSVDFQCLNGLGSGNACYEVRNGERTARLANAAILFRAPEFWRSVQEIGGIDSLKRYAGVSSLPLIAKGVAVIDILRKA